MGSRLPLKHSAGGLGCVLHYVTITHVHMDGHDQVTVTGLDSDCVYRWTYEVSVLMNINLCSACLEDTFGVSLPGACFLLSVSQ